MQNDIEKSMDIPMDSWISGSGGEDFHQLASRFGVRSLIIYGGLLSRPPVYDNPTISNQ